MRLHSTCNCMSFSSILRKIVDKAGGMNILLPANLENFRSISVLGSRHPPSAMWNNAIQWNVDICNSIKYWGVWVTVVQVFCCPNVHLMGNALLITYHTCLASNSDIYCTCFTRPLIANPLQKSSSSGQSLGASEWSDGMTKWYVWLEWWEEGMGRPQLIMSR